MFHNAKSKARKTPQDAIKMVSLGVGCFACRNMPHGTITTPAMRTR